MGRRRLRFRRAALLRRRDCFDLIRIGPAAGIVCFHSFPITYGNADAIGLPLQAAAKLILPAPDLVPAFCCGAALFRFSERIPAKPSLAAFCFVYAMHRPGTGARSR
jgi:hypothetical protein